MDTEIDVSCIADKVGPGNVPTLPTPSTNYGVGHVSNLAQSPAILFSEEQVNRGTSQPYMIPSLPFNYGGEICSVKEILLLTPSDLPML